MTDVLRSTCLAHLSYHEMACRITAFDPLSSPALSTRSISARISLRFSRSDFASSYLRCALASCTKLSRRASCSNNGWSICARAASRSATSLASGIEVPFLDGDAVAEGLGRDCSFDVYYDVSFVRWYVRSVCIIIEQVSLSERPIWSVRMIAVQNEKWRLRVGMKEISVRFTISRRVVAIPLLRFKGRTWSGNRLRCRNRFARLIIAA